MERKIKDLMQILDDELKVHQKGYVSRQYKIYADAFASRNESGPPYVWLNITNPRGRAKPTREDCDAEFSIKLELYKTPYIPDKIYALDPRLQALGAVISPPDMKEDSHFQPGDVIQGSITAKLTLENYNNVFQTILAAYRAASASSDYLRPFMGRESRIKDHRGWILKQISEKLNALHSIFKKVYTGLPPPEPQKPKLKPGYLF
jgi:hypothetical protein